MLKKIAIITLARGSENTDIIESAKIADQELNAIAKSLEINQQTTNDGIAVGILDLLVVFFGITVPINLVVFLLYKALNATKPDERVIGK